MKTLKIRSGSEPFEVVSLDGVAISADGGEVAFKLLKLRRDWMDREFGARECAAKRKRHLAEATQCRRQIESSEGLAPDRLMDIEGRAEEAEARADYCRHKGAQYQLEISVYRTLVATIKDANNGFH